MYTLWTTCLAQSRQTGSPDGIQACPIQWKGRGLPRLEHEVCGTHADEGTVQCCDEMEPLVDGATAEQRSEHGTKAAEREKIMKGINNRNNEVWCNLVLVLDNTTLMCLRSDCFNQRTGFGDGALAWNMLLDRFNSSERPTVVSLVGQLAKLRLGPTEKLDDYFVRSQELMTRLSDAGERISNTLFNALVINGLPEQYEHFVVQESFQPATTSKTQNG